jgi:hypothetical protein
MTTYTIHQPPLRDGEASPDPERFVFVRDGFYFWAFVFGPLWMLRHRLWLVFLLYIIVVAALSAALWYSGVRMAAPFVHFLVALLIGFEAATLRRWTLARRGWKNLGVVVADDLESAERRFFDAWVARDERVSKSAPTPQPPPAPQPRRMQPAPDVIGLFPEPGAPR